MDTIVRRFNRQVRTFYVYSQDEADKQQIPYTEWRLSTPGTWALTDDGYVVECLRIREYRDVAGRPTRELTFSIGKAWDKPYTRLEYIPRKLTGNFYATKARTWQDTEAGKSRVKRTVDVYVQQILNGKVDYEQLGRVYRPDQKIPAATVKRLLKQERIKRMVDERLKEVLQSRGITEGFVLDKVLEAIKIAEEKMDPANVLRAAESLMRILGMDSTKAKNTVQISLSGVDYERRLREADEELKKLSEAS